MPTVEKTHGGPVYHRALEQQLSIGDRVDVGEELAAYLCEDRDDFALADGVEELAEPTDLSVDGPEAGTLPFSPETYTVDELEERIEDIDDLEELRALRNLERDQKSRETALDAFEARIADLEED